MTALLAEMREFVSVRVSYDPAARVVVDVLINPDWAFAVTEVPALPLRSKNS